MNELTPATVIVEAHRILKSLVQNGNSADSVLTKIPAALSWLEERQMVEAIIDEEGNMQYEITRWGRAALLGRQAA